MEMCYDGALVMPKSYAVMDQDEMCYVEGGGLGQKKYNKVTNVAIVIDCALIVLGFGAAVYSARTGMKCLVKVANGNTSRELIKKLTTCIGVSMAATFWTAMDLAMTAFGTSAGEILAEALDRADRKNDGYIFA